MKIDDVLGCLVSELGELLTMGENTFNWLAEQLNKMLKTGERQATSAFGLWRRILLGCLRVEVCRESSEKAWWT